MYGTSEKEEPGRRGHPSDTATREGFWEKRKPKGLFPSNCRKASVQEKWEEAKNPKRGNQRGKVENLKVC